MENDSERRGFRVSGRVQGVGFRWATCRRAEQLGLRGSVRNLDDGSVEVHAQGTSSALEALAAWLAQGPSGARVLAVEAVASELPIPQAGFQAVH